MGWCSGSSLADEIWEIIAFHIPKDKRAKIAKALIDIFEVRDCDTMQETALWRLAYKTCPVCNHNGDGEFEDIDKCKNCNGTGETLR